MSDAVPVSVPPIQTPVTVTSGNSLPRGGKSAGKLADPNRAPAPAKSSIDEALQQLNKYLNDSGRANTFRVDPASRNQTIQEINTATGEVIGEFAVQQFPALVRSLGISGVLVDSHA